MVDVGELPSIASASPGPLVPENILPFLVLFLVLFFERSDLAKSRRGEYEGEG